MKNNKLISGIILIVLGVFLLLANLGYISFAALFSVFDLWPLIFVVVGINILFNKKPIINFITWIMFLIILIAYGMFFSGGNVKKNRAEFNTSFTKLTETSYGELELDIGAANVNIGSEEKDLLRVNSKGIELDYSHRYNNNKEITSFNFENTGHNIMFLSNNSSNYNFNLNENVIWDLDLDLGAISGVLNLEDIPIRSFDLDIGAGKLDVILGNKYKKSNIKIDGGVSTLSLVVPKDAAIKMKLDSGLSKINIDHLNLTKLEDYYISSNYEEADMKLDFDISMGVGKIDFKIK